MSGAAVDIERILDRIWLSGENWYGLERELTWYFIRGLCAGEPPQEAFWYAMCEWDV